MAREGVGREQERAPLATADVGEEVLGDEGDVLHPLPERRDVDRDDAEPVVEVVAEAARADRLDEVDVRGGDDRGRPSAAGALSPTRSKRRSWRTRRSLTWRWSGMSPTSSRKIVPPLAMSKRPTRSRTAPVKAPRTWPKSSLSRSSPGSAPQFTATKGPVQRGEFAWSARAMSSLPVPLSPVTRTVASLRLERLDEVDDPEHDGGAGDEPVRGEHRLDEAVVGLGRAEDDDVAGPRVAVARDVVREDGRRQRDEPGAPLAAAEDRPPPLLPEAPARAPRGGCRTGRRAARRRAPRWAGPIAAAAAPG